MNPFVRIIEILILVVLPLLVIYLRSNWQQKEIYGNVIILPIIWYVLYALLHELGHILGCLIVGLEIKDYQLFTHFWEGSFGFAFVDIKEGYGENMNSFVILILPYVLDLLSIFTGYYLLSRYRIKNSFLFGLVFLLFNIRPLYDLADNFIGYFLNHSDFVLASRISGIYVVFTFVLISIAIGIILILLILTKYQQYPKLLLEE
ncbi:MAG: hypothetical protein HY965_08940 [Ignavibacteriales bacterium]|nr:hypothetical protein [Ignavibacteriales bacterium]